MAEILPKAAIPFSNGANTTTLSIPPVVQSKSGDDLIVVVCSDTTPTFTWPTGGPTWTAVDSVTDSATYTIECRRTTLTTQYPGEDITFSTGEAANGIVYVFDEADEVDIANLETLFEDNGSVSNTFTFGSLTLPSTDDWLFLAGVGMDGSHGITTLPTGYEYSYAGQDGGAPGTLISFMHQDDAFAGPESAGTFTADGNDTGGRWMIGVRNDKVVSSGGGAASLINTGLVQS